MKNEKDRMVKDHAAEVKQLKKLQDRLKQERSKREVQINLMETTIQKSRNKSDSLYDENKGLKKVLAENKEWQFLNKHTTE
jgi:hypothetical protein